MWFNNGTVIYSMFLVVEGVNVDSSIRTKLGTCIVSSDPLDSPPHSRNWPCPLFTLLTSRPSNLDPMESLLSAPARFWVPTLAFHKSQFVSKIDNFPCQLLSCLCPGGWRGKIVGYSDFPTNMVFYWLYTISTENRNAHVTQQMFIFINVHTSNVLLFCYRACD